MASENVSLWTNPISRTRPVPPIANEKRGMTTSAVSEEAVPADPHQRDRNRRSTVLLLDCSYTDCRGKSPTQFQLRPSVGTLELWNTNRGGTESPVPPRPCPRVAGLPAIELVQEPEHLEVQPDERHEKCERRVPLHVLRRPGADT